MATMQQPGAEDRVGVQFDRRDARVLFVALTIIAAVVGAAVVFTQSGAQKTTTAGITETLRFPEGGPYPIVVGTDALWVGINPAYARALQTGQEAQTQKFGSLERVNLSGAVERTLRLPGFVGPASLHLGNALWVSRNSDPTDSKPGELDKLDWNTGQLLARLPLDHGVSSDPVYGDGSLWVTVGSSPATLVRVNPVTVRPIGKPIVIAPGQAFGSTFGDGAVWQTGFDDGSLARVDPATGQVRRIKLGGAAVGVIVSGGSVWVALRNQGTVVRVDPRTLRVLHTTTVGANPAYLAAASGLIWVANQSDGTVTRIDARTGDAVGLPVRITSDDASNLTAAGNSVWVTSEKHSSATRIDINQAR